MNYELFASLRVTIEKNFRIFMRPIKLVKSVIQEKIKKLIEPASEPCIQTGKELRAMVLHGPRNLRTGFFFEKPIQSEQVLKKQHSFLYYFSYMFNCVRI